MVEDESDVKAAKELKAEVRADIAEFDENELNNVEGTGAGDDEDRRRIDELAKFETEINSIENEV